MTGVGGFKLGVDLLGDLYSMLVAMSGAPLCVPSDCTASYLNLASPLNGDLECRNAAARMCVCTLFRVVL